MSSSLTRAARRPRVVAAAAAVSMAVVAALVISQGGVTGAEQDPAAFTVAGDGGLPTTKPPLGESREPLSTDETGYAIHLASTDRSIPAGATNVRGESGPEILQVDVPDDVDAGGRTAVVVLYDHSDDTTYRQLVDLAAGRVVHGQPSQQLQPPTSADEAAAAITIAIGAAAPPTFAEQFATLEGVPLVSPEQVRYVAGAWTFDGTTPGGSACGKHRCARLMVQTPSGIYLDTSDVVVDLSTGLLIDLEKP